MPESIIALLKNIADFVAKLFDAIKQVFDSFKPADSDEATGE